MATYIETLRKQLKRAEQERDVALQDVSRLASLANRRAVESAALREKLARAVYIAEHLFQMVPQGVWRDSGGDDMQGHYEGDYWAEKVREELAVLAASGGTQDAPPASALHPKVLEWTRKHHPERLRSEDRGGTQYEGLFPDEIRNME